MKLKRLNRIKNYLPSQIGGSLYFIFMKLPRLRSHGSDDAEFVAPIAQEVNYFGQSFDGLGLIFLSVHEDNHGARRVVAQVF